MMSGDSKRTRLTRDAAVGTDALPLVVAAMHRPQGITGVHTHVEQLRRYLEAHGGHVDLVTPFSSPAALRVPVFGPRVVLQRLSPAAGVVWHRHWHEVFLRRALSRRLAGVGDCVIYAQDPLAARAALHARRGPHQRVVMAVHFRISQADEWADKQQIARDGKLFRAIRQDDREVIPRVDGVIYVSRWAREALLSWLPEVSTVPYAIIGNFVAPIHVAPVQVSRGDLVTVGGLEIVKNHRFLLHVLAEARRAGRVFSLDVFGEGPCRDDLNRLARSLGVEEQVRLRGFRRDVRALLPSYRGYVHASYSESSSLAIMEAMAAGLPVLTADIGPMRELFGDGVEARFWSLDDPQQAASTLIDFLGCETTRATAAAAATARFQRDFDAERVVPRLMEFLAGRPVGVPPDSKALNLSREAGH